MSSFFAKLLEPLRNQRGQLTFSEQLRQQAERARLGTRIAAEGERQKRQAQADVPLTPQDLLVQLLQNVQRQPVVGRLNVFGGPLDAPGTEFVLPPSGDAELINALLAATAKRGEAKPGKATFDIEAPEGVFLAAQKAINKSFNEDAVCGDDEQVATCTAFLTSQRSAAINTLQNQMNEAQQAGDQAKFQAAQKALKKTVTLSPVGKGQLGKKLILPSVPTPAAAAPTPAPGPRRAEVQAAPGLPSDIITQQILRQFERGPQELQAPRAAPGVAPGRAPQRRAGLRGQQPIQAGIIDELLQERAAAPAEQPPAEAPLLGGPLIGQAPVFEDPTGLGAALSFLLNALTTPPEFPEIERR